MFKNIAWKFTKIWNSSITHTMSRLLRGQME